MCCQGRAFCLIHDMNPSNIDLDMSDHTSWTSVTANDICSMVAMVAVNGSVTVNKAVISIMTLFYAALSPMNDKVSHHMLLHILG